MQTLSFAPMNCIDDDHVSENTRTAKSNRLIKQKTTLHVQHAFLYNSWLLLHEFDVKMPNFKFYGGRKQATTNFSLSF